MDPEEVIKQLTQQLEEATAKVTELAGKLDGAASAEDVKSLQAEIQTLQEESQRIKREKEEAERALSIKSMRAQLETQRQEIDDLKSFRMPSRHEYHLPAGQKTADAEPFSFKVFKARRMQDPEAIRDLSEMRTKALAEGGPTTGGYLVPPEYLQQLVELRRPSSPLRNYVTVVGGFRTNLVYVPTQQNVSTVAWVAENGTKPSTDEVYGEIAVNIFTLAGIAKVSNQLLEDSAPAVDTIVRNDISRGLGIEEDRAMINGSGTGQPTGILNTSGVTTTAASVPTGTANAQAAALIDDMIAAVGRIQATYFGNPDLFLLHPRTWTKIATAKDGNGRYLSEGVITPWQGMTMPTAANPTPTNGTPVGMFFNIPVVMDANVPINLTTGNGANRSVIVAGAFREAWLMERDGITLDVSSEAGTSFEQNQTWFRGEERVGFTAARLPIAFQIISDVGA